MCMTEPASPVSPVPPGLSATAVPSVAAPLRAPAVESEHPAPARRMWDLVLTIVLLVLYLVGVALASASSFFFAFAGDSCGASSVCDYDQIANAIMVVLIGPWVPVIFVLGAAIFLLATRRVAFWVPLVGGVLTIAAVVIGWVLVGGAVSPVQLG
jgi:uncharacterized BrkB/YihY/UPF0761 family membrane protein